MKNPKMHIAIAMLAAFLSCAGIPAVSSGVTDVTVCAAEMSEIKAATKLEADKTYEGDLTISADLNLNGHKLTVKGNLYQTAGTITAAGSSSLNVTGDFWHKAGLLYMEDGSVTVGGSYEMHQAAGVAGSGEFQLRGTGKSVFTIGGNMVIDSTIGRSYYQGAGLIKIGGDLKCYAPSKGEGLEPSTNVTVHFTGEQQHEIYFENAEYSHLSNVSADKGSTLLLTGQTSGFTLASDLTLAGGSVLSGGNMLKLNEHTLTVDGDFIHAGTQTVNAADSTLHVTGDYWQKSGLLYLENSTVQVDGSYELHEAAGVAGSGEFQMRGDTNSFQIGGNAVIDSTIGHSYYQAIGTIQIGGDLLVYSPNGGEGFEPAVGVTIDFTGKKQHKIYFDSTEYNHLSRISASKESSIYLDGQTGGFHLASDLTLVGGSRVSGSQKLKLDGFTLNVAGDFYQSGGLTVDVTNSKLTVGGDYWQAHGILYMENSTVNIAGNYELHEADGVAGNGEFQMRGEDNTLQISGNMIIDSTIGHSYYQGIGTIKIGGDLKCYAPEGGEGLEPSGNVTMHFTGKNQHEIYFESTEYSHLSNISADKDSTLLLTGQTSGFTLASDLTLADGSKISGGNNLKLNENTLTVKGDFFHAGTQTVDVTAGTLHVTGNYWQKSGLLYIGDANVKIDGNYELHEAAGVAGSGEFQMRGDGKAMFEIGGNMIIDSTIARSYYQGAGTIKIGGDLKCYAPSGGEGLEPSVNVTIIFTGSNTHEIYFDSSEYSHLSNVGTEGGGSLYLTGNTSGFTLVSDVTLIDGSKISGGNRLNLNGKTMTVSGSFYQNGPEVNIAEGTLLVAENYWQQHGLLYIENGTVNIGNHYEMHEASGVAGSGELQMRSDNAKLIVGGDAIFDSTIARSLYQTKGIICIGGNLKAYAPDSGQGLENTGVVMEFRGGKEHEAYFASTGNYTGTLRIGIGDTLKFTGVLDGIEQGSKPELNVVDASLASVSGLSLTGKKAGEGTLTFSNGSTTRKIGLIVGASDTEDPYLGVTTPPVKESTLLGDINGDGTFSISDAILLTRWLSGDETADIAIWKNGDFNADDKLTAVDLSMMKNALIGRYTTAEVIISNFNISAVSNHPTVKSTFTVEKECKVFSILTYHWNNGTGKIPGTIGLLEDGVSIGTWSTTGTKGQNGADDCNWWAYPGNLVLKPGHTYTVVDSDPQTWSHNGGSKGAGFFEVKGTYTAK